MLNDIKHYYTSKNLALSMYYNSYKNTLYIEENANYNWLLNDIELFMNNYVNFIYGLNNCYFSILQRHIFFNNKNKIIKFIKKNKFENTKSLINFYWGILLPQERIQILKDNYSINELINEQVKLFDLEVLI